MCEFSTFTVISGVPHGVDRATLLMVSKNLQIKTANTIGFDNMQGFGVVRRHY